MMTLVVKGNVPNAKFHANKRGIKPVNARKLINLGETIMQVNETDRDQVVNWYCEDLYNVNENRPFGVGTLLHYSES